MVLQGLVVLARDWWCSRDWWCLQGTGGACKGLVVLQGLVVVARETGPYGGKAVWSVMQHTGPAELPPPFTVRAIQFGRT